jgi:RsiW-degrading membrane proteinase PrsW (M82 family)
VQLLDLMVASPAVAALRTRHIRLALAALAIFVLGAILWSARIARADELFVLAVAPAIFMLWQFHHADKYKAESSWLLLGTFVLGGLFTLVCVFVEPKQPAHQGVVGTFFFFLFGVALFEELSKFFAVRILPYRSKRFDETMDGVIFGITAGLGFAAVENIFYVFQYGGGVALFRAFVSVPGHAFYGAIMGYYLARAKFEKKPLLAVSGLAIAMLLHAIFDTVAQASGMIALIVLPAFVWIVYFGVVKKEIAKCQSESLYLPPA